MKNFEQWNGFKGNRWKEKIDVRNFIGMNYTPYDGDASFLEGPTEATNKLWGKLQALQKEERAKGGVLDMETEVVTSLTAYGPGYIDEETKDLEKVVGLQTDKPLKRAFMPYGGIKMAEQACETYGYKVDPQIHDMFTKYEFKTHNQGVFDIYTPEMKRARHSHILTGLPDTYGRGRIVGDYRRVALYGIDALIEGKQKDFAACDRQGMRRYDFQLREEIADQIRALKGMKVMAESYGYDISKPAKDAREAFVQSIVDEVKAHLDEAGIEATVGGRVKHFFSIYKKMLKQNKTLDQIYDLFAVRIMVDTVKDCYAALGVIHEMYKPIPGRFKDYIAMPKQNMYQSLHTTLIGSTGQPFEIQIRTYEMHRTAEYGIAAHWKYKESGSGQIAAGKEEEKLSWLRQILEWQRDTDDSKEFLSMVKGDLDLFSDSVYCFTPSGDVKTLPSGSTPIDFAYSIHSAVGNKMVGARVNGKLVPIEYQIQNGDRIEIITSQNSKGPSRDWLKLVRSTQAKNKINQWFKTQMKEDNIIRGRDAIDRYCKAKGINLADLSKPEFMEKVMNRYAFKDWDSVLASIGHGGLKEGQVINKMLEEREKKLKREITDAEVLDGIADTDGRSGEATVRKNKSGIVVKGLHDLAVRFSRCCNPVPGDEIVGFVTRGRGVSIHRTDCINVINLPEDERGRLIDAEWQVAENPTSTEQYSTEIQIFANNRIGLFADISKVFTEKQIDITSMNVRTSKQGRATIIMTFDIHGTEELNRITDKIRQIDGVLDIQRTTG